MSLYINVTCACLAKVCLTLVIVVTAVLPVFSSVSPAVQIWNAASQEHSISDSSGPASRLHSALMAVLTHMVGRLGSLAIQDPHIQSVLYALLQKGVEGSPAEQEVLVEDAMKLLNATLSASSTLDPPLQV